MLSRAEAQRKDFFSHGGTETQRKTGSFLGLALGVYGPLMPDAPCLAQRRREFRGSHRGPIGRIGPMIVYTRWLPLVANSQGQTQTGTDKHGC